MHRTLVVTALTLALIPFVHAQEAANTHSGNWWDPADGGWGVATLDQGNILGPYWFSYDDEGRPTWLMGIGLPQDDGSYAGDLYRFTGLPFQAIADAPSITSEEKVGSIHLDFGEDPHAMAFTTVIDGQTVTRDLTRFDFGGKDVVCAGIAAADANEDMNNYTDMWWEPATTGWGINVIHLDERIYGQWYTYETPDQPVFMTLGLERQGDGSYLGSVYRQNDGGRPFRSPSKDGSEPGAEVVGTASLLFLDGQHAEFDYVIDEHEGHHDLIRFQFGDMANQCTVQPYATDDGDNGGDDGDDDNDDGGNGGDDGGDIAGQLCTPAYAIGDSRTLRSLEGEGADPYVFTETITGTASFNGQDGLRQTVSHAGYADDGRYAYNYLGNGDNTILSFGAEALEPGTDTVISTSKNDPARVEAPRYFTTGETVALDYGVNSTGSMQGVQVQTRTDLKTTYRLVGMETVTVPAGSFTACKLEFTLDSKSVTDMSVGGSITIDVQKTGFIWSDPVFGMVKEVFEGTSKTTAYGTTTTAETFDKQELLEATMAGNHTP